MNRKPDTPNPLAMIIEDVKLQAMKIRDSLAKSLDEAQNRIDTNHDPVPPFCGTGPIKLIIIGQDPTIRNAEQRKMIKATLNLDKDGALKTYIEKKICEPLGISLGNVYATNLFKYFYSDPPADTPGVLKQHLLPNLELLRKELAMFPGAVVLTLGEPVLKLLVLDDQSAKVRFYWDYDVNTHETDGKYSFCPGAANRIGRDFFPFPHQPSMRKRFYLATISAYVSFVKGYLI